MNLKLKEKEKIYENIYIDSKSQFSRSKSSNSLYNYLTRYYSNSYSDLVIVCIGTDRSTGDSLGPLVGHNLNRRLKTYDDVHVFGTLNNPVHAKNLEDNMELINSKFKRPFIVAIDACLGSYNNVGFISISNKPVKPGSGVNKILPPIGHLSILGIVNTSGFMEYAVLQSTRLNLVMDLADIISSSLLTSIWKLKKTKAETQLS